MDCIAMSGVVLDCKEAREVMVMSVLSVSKQKNGSREGLSLQMATLALRWEHIRQLELRQLSPSFTPERNSPLSRSVMYTEKSCTA
jgi:hypothetical protein